MSSNTILILTIPGNPDILEEINSNVDFSYVRILKMMYARDDDVRLLAGSALAAFAYNNINQQKEIAEQGGVRFNCFVPFLQSSDEHFRCNAAFQVSGKAIKSHKQFCHVYLSNNLKFPTMWYVLPAKAWTSLRIRAVWSEPLIVAWIFYDS